MNLTLSVLPGKYAVCRLNAGDQIPAWARISTGARAGEFVSIARTTDELSIVCPETAVPESVKCERGWRIFKVEGPLDLSLTGVLAALAAPLAEARINIFAVSTFDTDYLLVKDALLSSVIETLIRSGHRVKSP